MVFLAQQVKLINILLVLSWLCKNECAMLQSVRNKEDGETVNKFIFKNPFQQQEHKTPLSPSY